MNLKRTLLALMFASAFGGVSAPVQAQQLIIQVAPPPVRYEAVPTHTRRGYIWENGYWRWNGRRHVWVAGHWERHRPGYVYVAPRWVERNGKWEYHPRRWDRDGDGVPNRLDRAPNNPGRS